MKCPICDKEIKTDRDYMDNILMEESAECKDDFHFYSYQYITGSTEEVIGNVAFYGNHADSKEVRELHNKQYKAVLELEREYYQKKINIKGEDNERSKKIFEILKLIKIIWETRPEERFHQLISNLQHEYIKDTGETGWLMKNQIVKVYNHTAYLEENTYIDMFHLEDDKFLEWLKKKVKEL